MKITPIQLAKKIEKWGQALSSLGVAHWDIEEVCVGTLDFDGEESSKAMVRLPVQYDSCSFYFNSDELDRMDERELNETIIHEWLHVAMRDHDRVMHEVEGWMPPKTYSDFETRLRHERENLVMRLAVVLNEFHSGAQPRFAPPK